MEIERDNKKIRIITYLESPTKATIFKHFKGQKYTIISIAKDSEDLKVKVVYRGEYDDNPIWIRSYEDFFGEVDHSKYPEIKQKYRFEIKEKIWKRS